MNPRDLPPPPLPGMPQSQGGPPPPPGSRPLPPPPPRISSQQLPVPARVSSASAWPVPPAVAPQPYGAPPPGYGSAPSPGSYNAPLSNPNPYASPQVPVQTGPSFGLGGPGAYVAADTRYESVTVTRGDLSGLRSSRNKAWLTTVLVLVGAGAAGYFAFEHKRALDLQITTMQKASAEATQKNDEIRKAAQAKQEAATALETKLAALGPIADEAAKQAAAREQLDKRLGENVAVLRPAFEGQPVEIGADAGSLRLKFAEKGLFAEAAGSIGLEGYRLLLRAGKSIKEVPGLADSQVTVVVNSVAAPAPKKRKGKAAPVDKTGGWDLAAARSVALARFLVDDVGMDPKNVTVAVPAPVAAQKGAKAKAPLAAAELRFEGPAVLRSAAPPEKP